MRSSVFQRFAPYIQLASVVLSACSSGEFGEPLRFPDLYGVAPAELPQQRFIVVMKEDAMALRTANAGDHAGVSMGLAPARTYRHVMQGFVATMTELDAIALAQNPTVASVEPDAVMALSNVQQNPPWGLDRIDQRALPLDGRYDFGPPGVPVHAYVVDTGIQVDHVDFAGRADRAFSALDGAADYCNRHGTHVAGILAGRVFGVAKDALLHSVQVFGCHDEGALSDILAGIEWVIENAQRPAVVNMSFGGETNRLLNRAVRRMIDAGIAVVVSAGNDAVDACQFSPANVREALTIGAADRQDARAGFSNVGSCLDLFAPGTEIRSAAANLLDATQSISLSGTSMAAPHVAGVVALHLAHDPTLRPAEIAGRILGSATMGALRDVDGSSPNRLLFTEVVSDETTCEMVVSQNADGDVRWQTRTNGHGCTYAVDGVSMGSVGCNAEGVVPWASNLLPGEGTYIVTLQVADGPGGPATCDAEVSLVPPRDTSCAVTVSPEAGSQGTVFRIRTQSNARSCSWSLRDVPQGPIPCSGETLLDPFSIPAGRLEVRLHGVDGPGQDVSCATFVNVQPETHCALDITPQIVRQSESFDYSFVSRNGTECAWAVNDLAAQPIDCTTIGTRPPFTVPPGKYKLTFVARAPGASPCTVAKFLKIDE